MRFPAQSARILIPLWGIKSNTQFPGFSSPIVPTFALFLPPPTGLAGELTVAFLKVIRGAIPGQILELYGERMVMGRHPNCQIVLDNAAVSRHHAQILESHGHFYLEDLRSRNHTYLNGTRVEGRAEIQDGDEIKVCDVGFRFHVQGTPHEEPTPPTPIRKGDTSVFMGGNNKPKNRTTTELPNGMTIAGNIVRSNPPPKKSPPSGGGSSIISTLDVSGAGSSNLRLSVKPEVKLRAIIDISNALAHILALDEVSAQVLDKLFQIFPQADEGFIMLEDEETERLSIQASKVRLETQDATIGHSMTIVRQAMDGKEAILSADAVSDNRFKTSDSVPQLKIHSMMCVPLMSKDNRAMGVIQIATHNVRQKFVQDDLDLLVSVASQAALAVENSRLHEKLVEQREMQRDLEVATQIQLGFLPNQRPIIKGYDFYDHYESAQSIGGDYFDYVPLRNKLVAVAVADVAGKGIPAALLMARLYSAARFHLLTQSSVAKAMTGLNREIASSGLGFRFITCVIAILNPRTHELTISNAGHLPPLLRHANGEVEQVARGVGGLPLGVMPDQVFQEIVVPLAPGDTFVAFTDGITEAMNSNNDLYGNKLLTKYLATGPKHPEELVKGLIQDVETYTESRPQSDDMCLVCLRRGD